jgi:hypothetical protein
MDSAPLTTGCRAPTKPLNVKTDLLLVAFVGEFGVFADDGDAGSFLAGYG